MDSNNVCVVLLPTRQEFPSIDTNAHDVDSSPRFFSLMESRIMLCVCKSFALLLLLLFFLTFTRLISRNSFMHAKTCNSIYVKMYTKQTQSDYKRMLPRANKSSKVKPVTSSNRTTGVPSNKLICVSGPEGTSCRKLFMSKSCGL